MKVYGLDGREYNWKLAGYSVDGDEERPRSAYHLRARALLEALFPCDSRLEEVPLPGTGKLTADFYIPSRRLLVEVQGEQHDEYVEFFHKHKLGFVQSKQRDASKARWAEINGINFVELPHDESDTEWTRRVNSVLTPADSESEDG